MIKQYEKAKRVLETRWKQREEKRKKRDAELSKSYWFYQDKITNIEKEIRNLLSKQSKEKERIQKAFNDSEEKREEADKPLNETIEKANREFRFMDLIKSENDRDTSFEVRFPGQDCNYYIEEIYEVLDYGFTLKVFIAENGKPVNKYSIILVARHIYGDLIKPIYRQHLPFYCDGAMSTNHYTGFDIEKRIKDASTVEYLKTQFEKNKDKILKPFLDELAQCLKEWDQAQRHMRDEQYQIAYTKWKMSYHKHQYSGGTELEAYKELEKELATLEGNKLTKRGD